MDKKQTDITKGIAILCMLFHHLFYKEEVYTVYRLTGLIINRDVTYAIANDMKMCVAIFAFLSGYGMLMKAKAATESQNKLGAVWFAKNMIKGSREFMILNPFFALFV